jgi:hypothetical protein
MSQLVEHFQEMANASRHPIEGSNEHDVEAMAPSICFGRFGDCAGLWLVSWD